MARSKRKTRRQPEPQPVASEPKPPRSISPLQREILAIALFLLSVFVGGAVLLHGLALFRSGWAGDVGTSFGWIGANLAAPMTAFFGWPGALLLTIAPAAHALRLFGRIGASVDRSWLVFLVGGAALVPIAIGLVTAPQADGAHPLAGLWGEFAAFYLTRLGGNTGAWILWALMLSALMAASLRWNPVRMLVAQRWRRSATAGETETPTLAEKLEPPPEEMPVIDVEQIDEPRQPVAPTTGNGSRTSGAARSDAGVARRERRTARATTAPAELGDDELPPVDLLTQGTGRGAEVRDDNLKARGERLVEVLRTFRVESELQDWKSGPVVTQFRIVPAIGVKVRQIANLANDLALAMKAESIRIVAPVPGIGAVGIELPNQQREIVALRDLFETPAYSAARAALPLALGKDLEGKPLVTDLAQMPHLLIAGATGAGKSVCINTIITSLIYRHTPKTLRFVLIDPKMVELSMYNALPHLRHKVVTDNRDAAAALKWAQIEMEDRYKLLAENGARNLQEFNAKVRAGTPLRLPRDPTVAFENTEYKGGILPYVVVIIDELADLMMTVQGEVETPLAKLAQKARAIGIHLILATQRPSVNVITGLIKANFPSRIAFRVASQVDSRTILDGVGAESLLGYGDMLFLPPGKAEPARLQGAFISSEDTEKVMGWYDARRAARQAEREQIGIGLIEPAQEPDILEVVRAREAVEAGGDGGDDGEAGDRDKLFREAAEIVIQHQQGSTSLLQRRLKVGYGRAARIIDQLHAAGVLGPPEGSKPRDVLVGLDEIDRICGAR